MGCARSFNRTGPRAGNLAGPKAHRRHSRLRGMRCAVVFPGQGSQGVGMADPWVGHPDGKAVLDDASDALGRDVVAGGHDEASLATTGFVQPALPACDVAAVRVLRAEGLPDPVGVAGHSLGEFAALVAAEALAL